MHVWLIASLLALPAQDGFEDMPPPPPPLEELEEGVEADEPAAPPPAPRPRVRSDDEGDDDDDDAFAPDSISDDGHDDGEMDPTTVRALQILAGCASAFVALAITAVPYLGCFAYLLLMPALVATVETFLGDALGSERGTLFWPMVGAYAAHAAAGTFFSVLFFGGFYWLTTGGGGGFLFGGGDPCMSMLLVYGALFLFGAVTGVVWGGAVGVTPALIYGATAEEKRAGDDDLRFPGFFEPNHPEKKRKKKRTRGETAMAF